MILFMIAASVAAVSTILVILQKNAVHALLYLIVSFFAVAVIFLLLGAPFVAALEVIVYAGAIMVLFIFAVMLIGAQAERIPPSAWIAPVVLSAVILAEIVYTLVGGGGLTPMRASPVSPREVGVSLIGRYALGVEVAAFILLAGLVGAYHLGRRKE
jgi:NADH-quinone oxidoreductase subunit J